MDARSAGNLLRSGSAVPSLASGRGNDHVLCEGPSSAGSERSEKSDPDGTYAMQPWLLKCETDPIQRRTGSTGIHIAEFAVRHEERERRGAEERAD